MTAELLPNRPWHPDGGTATGCHGTAIDSTNEYGALPLTATGTAITASHTPLFRVAVVAPTRVVNHDRALRALLSVLGFRLSHRFDGCALLRWHRVYALPQRSEPCR